MKIGLSISIDVTKILKERLHKGEKGTYLDLTTFIDTDNPDQYGKHGFISQSQTKEERESGAEQTPILGNCKVFFTKESEQRQQSAPPPFPTNKPDQTFDPNDESIDDIPF
jgi:hypothetical protein